VIDPYLTYAATVTSGTAYGVTANGSGDAFATGVESTGGTPKAFVTELGPTGSTLWTTYIGASSGTTTGQGIALDSNGNVYVAGNTNTSGLATSMAYQTAVTGAYDAYVAELSPDGTLTYLTYLGGTGVTYGWGVAVDVSTDPETGLPADEPVVVGQTSSTSFPTEYPVQGTLLATPDAFATRFESSLSGLVYST
jgi:hypothetical protein